MIMKGIILVFVGLSILLYTLSLGNPLVLQVLGAGVLGLGIDCFRRGRKKLAK